MTLPKYTYLYGFTKDQIITLAQAPYAVAIQTKINAAKGLNERLLSGTYLEADTNRINAVSKAIKFNEELLSELVH